MSSIARRRKQLNDRESNLKSFLTAGKEGDNCVGVLGSKSKGLSVRKGEENFECVLEIGDKTSRHVIDPLNDKENVSPNIGTPSQEQSFRLKPSSKNSLTSSKNNPLATPTKPTEVSQSDPVLTQRTPADNPTSSDDIIALLTQDEPGENYFKLLAEERRKALKNTLIENEKLSEANTELTERNSALQSQLDSALELVQLYQKLLEDRDCSDNSTD